MEFARFMAGFWGRALRIVVGLGIIWWGVSMSSTGGTILAVVGLIVLLAGVFNVCILAPLFGAPFSGKDVLSSGPAAAPAASSAPEEPQQPQHQEMQQPGQ